MSWISWMLPHGASTFVGDVDRIYYIILAITGVAFVIVERRARDHRARAGRLRAGRSAQGALPTS